MSGLTKDFSSEKAQRYHDCVLEKLREKYPFDGDSWEADFVRLQFVALKPPSVDLISDY